MHKSKDFSQKKSLLSNIEKICHKNFGNFFSSQKYQRNVTKNFQIFHKDILPKKNFQITCITLTKFFHNIGKFHMSKIFHKCTRPFCIQKIFSNTYVEDVRDKFFM